MVSRRLKHRTSTLGTVQQMGMLFRRLTATSPVNNLEGGIGEEGGKLSLLTFKSLAFRRLDNSVIPGRYSCSFYSFYFFNFGRSNRFLDAEMKVLNKNN